MSLILDGSAGVTFPNSTVQASAGSVLQVASAVISTSGSTTSTSLQITPVTLSITPKFATSKILVICSLYLYAQENGQNQTFVYMRASLARGSTQLVESRISTNPGTTAIIDCGNNTPLVYLDSPATTSSVTYNIYISSLVYSYTANINTNAPSTITLMEIAG